MKKTRILVTLCYSLGIGTPVFIVKHSSAVGSMKYSDTTKNFKLNTQAFRDVPNTKGIRVFTFASNPMAGGYLEVNGQQVAKYQVQRAGAQGTPAARGFVTIGHFASGASSDNTGYYLVVTEKDFAALKQALSIIL